MIKNYMINLHHILLYIHQYQKLISDIGGYIKEYDEKLYDKFTNKKSDLNKVLKTISQKVG